MTLCPKCGTQVPGSFCPNCGAQVTAPSQPVAAANQVPPLPQNPPSPSQQPYGTPPQQPYGAPPQSPYAAPAQPPYGAPAQPPYGAPGQQPYGAPTQQPYGAPGYYPGPQKKGMGVGKILLIVVGVIIALFAILVVIGSMLPDEETNATTTTSTTTSASTTAKGVVKGPIITDKVDGESQEPLTAMKTSLPPSTDEIYAAVEIDMKAGQKLSAKWYYAGKAQDHLNTTLDIPKNFKGWASFNISNGGKPWPAGQFKVEILVDGVKAAETTFSVK